MFLSSLHFPSLTRLLFPSTVFLLTPYLHHSSLSPFFIVSIILSFLSSPLCPPPFSHSSISLCSFHLSPLLISLLFIFQLPFFCFIISFVPSSLPHILTSCFSVYLTFIHLLLLPLWSRCHPFLFLLFSISILYCSFFLFFPPLLSSHVLCPSSSSSLSVPLCLLLINSVGRLIDFLVSIPPFLLPSLSFSRQSIKTSQHTHSLYHVDNKLRNARCHGDQHQIPTNMQLCWCVTQQQATPCT